MNIKLITTTTHLKLIHRRILMFSKPRRRILCQKISNMSPNRHFAYTAPILWFCSLLSYNLGDLLSLLFWFLILFCLICLENQQQQQRRQRRQQHQVKKNICSSVYSLKLQFWVEHTNIFLWWLLLSSNHPLSPLHHLLILFMYFAHCDSNLVFEKKKIFILIQLNLVKWNVNTNIM